MKESGEIDQIVKTWLSAAQCHQNDAEPKTFGMDKVIMLFLMLSFSMGISLIVLAGEMIISRIMKNYQQQHSGTNGEWEMVQIGNRQVEVLVL